VHLVSPNNASSFVLFATDHIACQAVSIRIRRCLLSRMSVYAHSEFRHVILVQAYRPTCHVNHNVIYWRCCGGLYIATPMATRGNSYNVHRYTLTKSKLRFATSGLIRDGQQQQVQTARSAHPLHFAIPDLRHSLYYDGG